ncbi:alpha/beta fold hydrolase [Rhodococcus sp. NPDC019627]|uniref:alpha/beta fold hydrolase n=1 Tax=unclassified Rhodococcus (in: high G+C Gram-positive bacteria) TaxID=192944 RepID=UPI0034020860
MVHTGRVKHATNSVDGVRVAYETVGDGEPFVLIHGTALSHAIWRGFGYVRALRDRYRLILVDLRGHGRSDKPHDPASYAMDLMSADIVAVLDEVGLPSAHVLGYSLGGRVALALAVQYPERLESLIIGGGSSVYVDLILPATGVVLVGDVRVSRLPASPCGGAGLTVSHTDACGAGTCCFGVTPTRGVAVGRLRRTRRCRGLLGVGLVLSRDLRTGACSATWIAGKRPRRRVALPLPSRARLARFTPAMWSRLPPTRHPWHHAV